MLPWIVLFLMVSISQAFKINIEAFPGENITLNCTFSVHQENANNIRWMWKPVDEVANIEIVFDVGSAITEPNTRFHRRLVIGERKPKNGDASLLLKNVTSMDSGIFTCENTSTSTSTSPDRVISQIHLSVPPPKKQKPKISPMVSVNFILCIVIGFLGMVIIALIVKYWIQNRQSHHPALCNNLSETTGML